MKEFSFPKAPPWQAPWSFSPNIGVKVSLDYIIVITTRASVDILEGGHDLARSMRKRGPGFLHLPGTRWSSGNTHNGTFAPRFSSEQISSLRAKNKFERKTRGFTRDGMRH
jgi:hypothetical protein